MVPRGLGLSIAAWDSEARLSDSGAIKSAVFPARAAARHSELGSRRCLLSISFFARPPKLGEGKSGHAGPSRYVADGGRTWGNSPCFVTLNPLPVARDQWGEDVTRATGRSSPCLALPDSRRERGPRFPRSASIRAATGARTAPVAGRAPRSCPLRPTSPVGRRRLPADPRRCRQSGSTASDRTAGGVSPARLRRPRTQARPPRPAVCSAAAEQHKNIKVPGIHL